MRNRKLSRMWRWLLICGATLIWTEAVATEIMIETSQRMIEVDEKDASDVLTVVCSADGVFKSQTRAFYFRPTRGAEGGGTMTMTSADGLDGTGYNFFALASAKSAVVDVTLHISWKLKTSRGQSDITVSVPHFKPVKGKGGGFSYKFTWKKIDRK